MGRRRAMAAVRIRARMSRPHFIPIDHETRSRGDIASIAPEFRLRVVGRGSPANRSDCGPPRAQFLSDTAIHSRRQVTRSQSQCRLSRIYPTLLGTSAIWNLPAESLSKFQEMFVVSQVRKS